MGIKPFFERIHIDQLEQIVKSHISWNKIMKELGYKDNKSAKTLRKYLELKQIDYSHLCQGDNWRSTEKGKKLHKESMQTIDLTKVLIKDSKTSTKTIKNALLREGILENKCSICGSLPEWNGKLLTMILDHINGNRHDNRLENLQLHCPNCGYNLPTFSGRNKAYMTEEDLQAIENSKNRCETCNKVIYKGSKYCPKCLSISQRKVDRPPKDQLIQEIEELGFKGTGDKYGVRDNTIRKWVVNYDIDPKTVKSPWARNKNK